MEGQTAHQHEGEVRLDSKAWLSSLLVIVFVSLASSHSLSVIGRYG